MRGPLPIVAILYASGVVLAHGFELPLTGLFAVAFMFSIGALVFASLRRLLVWPLILLVGCVNLATRTAILSPCDLRALLGGTAELVTIRGVLTERPLQRVYERDQEFRWRTMARVEVKEVFRAGTWQLAFGRVAVSTPGVIGPEFFAGSSVEISGALQPPQSAAAEGLFDYRAYLQTLGIYYQLTVESAEDWRLLRTDKSPAGPPWSERFLRWAQATLAKGLVAEDESLRLLWAMALGWKTGLTGEVSEPFMQTGTLHIFAISGLHIALIAGILVSVLRVMRLPRAACGLLAVPLLWFYTAATGWQASAIRSTIMMNVIIGGWALKRPTDLVNSLAAAGLIILVWDPSQLFQAGFQLSFFVVLSIGLLLPSLEKVRQWLLQTDPFLPAELRPTWQRWLDGPLHYLTTSAATSLAAWLGSLPLIAYYFFLVTPVSLLANLLIVPLSGLTLMCTLGSLMCGDWLPGLTELFNHSAWFWMKGMVAISHWAAGLPGAYFYVRPPLLLEFVIYYAALGLCCSGWVFAPQRRRWAAVTAVVVLGVWLVQRGHADRAVGLTILPLGGSGIYCDAPGRRNDLLIDPGNRSAAEFTVRPFLRARGVKQLANVLLTHGDINHVGGWGYLNEQFSPASVLTSTIRFRSAAYRNLVRELENSKERWQQLRRGDRFGDWTVLRPDPGDHFAQADDNAIVLLGEFSGVRVLLLSDLGRLGQRALLEREKNLRTDIIVTGLPAQGEPVTTALIEALRPRLIIVASAEFPASARAGWKLRARLADTRVPVLYTSDVGAITLTLRSNGCEARAWKGAFAFLESAASDSSDQRGGRKPPNLEEATTATRTAHED
ncbi:MAG: ComEC/Rec2 family competence protein [Verrucomicrobia bacterium]|nr:ComEC/Rec2 family competence protein [Verrucomicrobiota bacterium]